MAVTEQTGALSDLTKKRLQDRREALAHGLSAYRLAAFVSEGCPNGEYRITRLSAHTYQIRAPDEAARDQLNLLGDRLAAAADHLRVQVLLTEPALNVTDQRLCDAVDQQPEAATDGGAVTKSESESGSGPLVGSRALPPVSDDDDDRTQRAKTEDMGISLLAKGGRYQVDSQSGSTYEVDVLEEECSCPDRADRCKHLRRTELEIKHGHVPRPDGRLPDL